MMSFGLINISISFQEYIIKTLAKKHNIFVIVYLDNIFINTNDDGDDYITAI